MAKKQILIIPDPLLRKVSEPVSSVNAEIKNLMDDMLETMYAAPGIGLAAVQIGVLKRIIVIDLSKDGEKKNPLFIVNPEITFKSNELISYEEGCLSIPNQFAEVKRPSSCKVNFLDYNGKKKEINANGLLATCIQHEVDHLDGILFIDHLSKLKKDLIIKKTKKQKKEIDRVIV
jgi:peptide deformylase